MPPSERVRVRAPVGRRFPIEGAKRRYITDTTAVEVILTAYYRRALRDGDLLQENP